MSRLPDLTSHKNSEDKELLRDAAESYYLYEGERVQLITVLAGRGKRIAIVETETGEQYDVPWEMLR